MRRLIFEREDSCGVGRGNLSTGQGKHKKYVGLSGDVVERARKYNRPKILYLLALDHRRRISEGRCKLAFIMILRECPLDRICSRPEIVRLEMVSTSVISGLRRPLSLLRRVLCSSTGRHEGDVSTIRNRIRIDSIIKSGDDQIVPIRTRHTEKCAACHGLMMGLMMGPNANTICIIRTIIMLQSKSIETIKKA